MGGAVSAGDRPQAFIVVLSGPVDVYLTGRTGREMLLYSATPGGTCVQTTLGMFADAAYTSEAIAESDLVITMVPKSVFEKLLAGSAAFRAFVFKALAARLKEMMNLLEQVAFTGIKERLARALLDRCVDGEAVLATHHELAIIIGSAREVVSRRLEALAAKGIVANERGRVRILSRQDLGWRRAAGRDW